MTTTVPPQRVAFALGANTGSRETTLRRAVLTLANVVRAPRIASLYHGVAVDVRGLATHASASFLNTAMVGDLDHSWRPEAVLAVAKALELTAGRDAAPRFADRPLDVDLLWLGDYHRCDPTLTLPHPELLRRRFVLAPLAEIESSMPLPPQGISVESALVALNERAPPVVRRAWRRPVFGSC